MGSGLLLFLTGVAIQVVLVFSLQAWTIRAQLDLLRRVQRAKGVGFTFEPDDLRGELGESPIRALLTTPGRSVQMLRLTTHRLDDPEAEALRRRYLRRRNLTVVALFGGLVFPIFFSSLGQW
jgi:hypothetical protein